MPNPPQPIFPAEPFISRDVPCHRCTYNLRGLRPDGRCPECGAPVQVSLRGERLRFADPIWLKQLSLGARMPYYALRGTVIAYLIVQTILFLLGSRPGRLDWSWPSIAGLLVPLAIGYGMLSYGLWIIAAPSGSSLASEPWYTPRRVLRISLLIAAWGSVVTAISLAIDPTSAAWIFIALTISPLGAVGALGSWGFCRYVRQLADRLPDDFTSRKSDSYFTGYIASWLLFAGAGTLGICTIGPLAGLYAFLPGFFCMFALGVLCLALPSYFMKKLEQEIKQAQQYWKETGATDHGRKD